MDAEPSSSDPGVIMNSWEIKVEQQTVDTLEQSAEYYVDPIDLKTEDKTIVKLEPSSPHFVSCNENFDEETDHTGYDLAADTSGSSFSQDPLGTNSSSTEHDSKFEDSPLEDGFRGEDEEKFEIDIEEQTIDVPTPAEEDPLMPSTSSHSGLAKCFLCSQCPRHFQRLYNLKVHQRSHTDNLTYDCHVCNRRYKTETYLRKHILAHERTDGARKCEQCGKSFTTERCLRRHCRLHHPIHICFQCGQRYAFAYDLDIHYKSHPGLRPFSCSTCNRSFKSSSSLNTHCKIHSGKFSCLVCGKSFASNTHLRGHEVSHTDEKPYECNTCKKTFKHKMSLKIHLTTVPGKSCQSTQCTICKRYFATASRLKLHLQTHLLRPLLHQCEVCSVLIPVEKVQEHMRLHASGEARVCDICGVRIVLLADLKAHRGEFSCSVCGDSFRCRAFLQNHVEMHAIVWKTRLREILDENVISPEKSKTFSV